MQNIQGVADGLEHEAFYESGENGLEKEIKRTPALLAGRSGQAARVMRRSYDAAGS